MSSPADRRDPQTARLVPEHRLRHALGRWLFLMPLLLLQLVVTCAWDAHLHIPRGMKLFFIPVAVPPAPALRELGPFKLDAIWEMRSTHMRFGGYSSLVPLSGGRLIAVSDRGSALRFSPPGEPPSPAISFPVTHWSRLDQTGNDSESSTRDPATGTVWVGYETKNAIARFTPGDPIPTVIQPLAMADWPDNRGAEAMARLADGRFLVMREGFGGHDDDAFLGANRHVVLLFPADPETGVQPIRASLVGPDNFYVTDVAQIPDGRVLILMRRLVWPIPTRLAVRIVIADPARIHEGGDWRATLLAKINSTLPMDNFEGIAAVPMRNGKLRVWLISDANTSVSQRTLLWKMTLDPKDLPPPR